MNSALLASEHYLIPVKPDPISRVGIDLLRGVINRISENHGHDIDCIGIVVTIADKRTKVYAEADRLIGTDQYWKDKKFKSALPSRTAIPREQGNQTLILDTNEQDAKLALSQITSEFLQRVNDDGL